MDKLIVKNVTKIVKDRYILNDITFTVHEGEIFALVGASGTGKTAIAKTVLQLMFQNSGTIEFDRNDIGAMVADQEFYKHKSIIKTVKWFADLFTSQHETLPTHDEIINILNVVGLKARRNETVKNLSPARLTRLKLAIALVTRPGILVLDEPFLGLSEVESRHVRVILKTLADKFNTAILITAHDFAGIEEIFDTMAIVEYGRILVHESYNNLSRRNDRFTKICITTPTPDFAATVITDELGYKAFLYGNNDVVVSAHPDEAQKVYDFLKEKNVEITNVARVHKSIKELFFQLKNASLGGGVLGGGI